MREIVGWPARAREWYDEWFPYWSLPRWQLVLWSAVASSYLARHPHRLWSWWVDQYMSMLVERRASEARVQARLAALFPPRS